MLSYKQIKRENHIIEMICTRSKSRENKKHNSCRIRRNKRKKTDIEISNIVKKLTSVPEKEKYNGI